MIKKYESFIANAEFESIMLEMISILESGKFTSDNTYEWDLSNKSKLEKFIEKLPKEQVKKYFIKFIQKISQLPEKARKGIMIKYAGVFLSVASTALIINNKTDKVVNDTIEEFIEVNKTSSFDVAQEFVSVVEGDYSDDKKDIGNWVEFKLGDKTEKRFVGTKYGISAPVLKDYLGKLPTKDDMKNLDYDTAIDIYKEKYWNSQNLHLFSNQSIADILYDGCVNQGVTGVKNIMKKALDENGLIIPDSENTFSEKWIKQINTLDQETLFKSIKKYREERYKNTKTFSHHGKGWINRLNKITFKK